MKKTAGIHHITAIVGHPQKNADFYAGILGLRLIKKTVNFDDPSTYHLYFGNEGGEPGTIPIASGSVAVGHAIADDAIGHFDVVDVNTTPSIAALAVGISDALHFTRQGAVVIQRDISHLPYLATRIGINGEGR